MPIPYERVLLAARAAASTLKLLTPEGGLKHVDSLAAFDLITEMERELGTAFPVSALVNLHTFTSLEAMATALSSSLES